MMTTDLPNAADLPFADAADCENRNFLKHVNGLRPRRRNRTVIEGEEAFLLTLSEDDLIEMVRTTSRVSVRTRFKNHTEHTKLNLCACAAMLHDPARSNMAFLSVNLIEGETPASVLSAIRKRITRSNGGQGARYFGVFVNFVRVKRGRSISFEHHPHLHLVVLDSPEGSDTHKALFDYCRQRGKTKAARSGNLKMVTDLPGYVSYLNKNFLESQAAGQQHDDQVIIADPIRDVAEAIGQGKVDMVEAIRGAAPVSARPTDIVQAPTCANMEILAAFERDAEAMVRVVKRLETNGEGRLEAVRRTINGWAVIRGFQQSA